MVDQTGGVPQMTTTTTMTATAMKRVTKKKHSGIIEARTKGQAVIAVERTTARKVYQSKGRVYIRTKMVAIRSLNKAITTPGLIGASTIKNRL